jgi:hypothetical protein
MHFVRCATRSPLRSASARRAGLSALYAGFDTSDQLGRVDTTEPPGVGLQHAAHGAHRTRHEVGLRHNVFRSHRAVHCQRDRLMAWMRSWSAAPSVGVDVARCVRLRIAGARDGGPLQGPVVPGSYVPSSPDDSAARTRSGAPYIATLRLLGAQWNRLELLCPI